MIALINNGQKRREPSATPATTHLLLPSPYFLVFVLYVYLALWFKIYVIFAICYLHLIKYE